MGSEEEVKEEEGEMNGGPPLWNCCSSPVYATIPGRCAAEGIWRGDGEVHLSIGNVVHCSDQS